MPKRQATLHLARSLPKDATVAARLGASLKTTAELDGCCICGAPVQFFAVESWDPKDPRVRHLPNGPQDGELAFGVYAHEPSCPVLAEAEREERQLAGLLPSKER
jgi:hypothetical protein